MTDCEPVPRSRVPYRPAGMSEIGSVHNGENKMSVLLENFGWLRTPAVADWLSSRDEQVVSATALHNALLVSEIVAPSARELSVTNDINDGIIIPILALPDDGIMLCLLFGEKPPRQVRSVKKNAAPYCIRGAVKMNASNGVFLACQSSYGKRRIFSLLAGFDDAVHTESLMLQARDGGSGSSLIACTEGREGRHAGVEAVKSWQVVARARDFMPRVCPFCHYVEAEVCSCPPALRQRAFKGLVSINMGNVSNDANATVDTGSSSTIPLKRSASNREPLEFGAVGTTFDWLQFRERYTRALSGRRVALSSLISETGCVLRENSYSVIGSDWYEAAFAQRLAWAVPCEPKLSAKLGTMEDRAFSSKCRFMYFITAFETKYTRVLGTPNSTNGSNSLESGRSTDVGQPLDGLQQAKKRKSTVARIFAGDAEMDVCVERTLVKSPSQGEPTILPATESTEQAERTCAMEHLSHFSSLSAVDDCDVQLFRKSSDVTVHENGQSSVSDFPTRNFPATEEDQIVARSSKRMKVSDSGEQIVSASQVYPVATGFFRGAGLPSLLPHPGRGEGDDMGLEPIPVVPVRDEDRETSQPPMEGPTRWQSPELFQGLGASDRLSFSSSTQNGERGRARSQSSLLRGLGVSPIRARSGAPYAQGPTPAFPSFPERTSDTLRLQGCRDATPGYFGQTQWMGPGDQPMPASWAGENAGVYKQGFVDTWGSSRPPVRGESMQSPGEFVDPAARYIGAPFESLARLGSSDAPRHGSSLSHESGRQCTWPNQALLDSHQSFNPSMVDPVLQPHPVHWVHPLSQPHSGHSSQVPPHQQQPSEYGAPSSWNANVSHGLHASGTSERGVRPLYQSGGQPGLMVGSDQMAASSGEGAWEALRSRSHSPIHSEMQPQAQPQTQPQTQRQMQPQAQSGYRHHVPLVSHAGLTLKVGAPQLGQRFNQDAGTGTSSAEFSAHQREQQQQQLHQNDYWQQQYQWHRQHEHHQGPHPQTELLHRRSSPQPQTSLHLPLLQQPKVGSFAQPHLDVGDLSGSAQTAPKEEVVTKRLPDGSSVFSCKYCEVTSNRRSNLRRHIDVVHHAVKRFRCHYEGCDQVFSLKQHAQTHEKIVHLRARNHQCDVCQMPFSTRSNLRKHVKTMHTPTPDH
ncbi:B lymphocyte-induced maturation protein 1-like [Porphyridium purpureum]|uniref:B lymphocyte-induced maturation protein 1-like n=1 Tax=Porphyridium purpureum TaxID=35688 RepID=A0A5J4Z716_PORPP|nr:B lymphocyte-induced maturation protein 1-like [Porphyridium purpureum]|eukprot:POR3557..scf295_1